MAVNYLDYYKILGVERDADAKKIKAAYRKLARKWHPDLHSGKKREEAEEKIKEINEAYEVLSDPEKKALYDRLGPNWKNGERVDSYGFGDGVFYRSSNIDPEDLQGFSEFFSSLFGAEPGRQSRRATYHSAPVRGQDIESTIELSLEEAYHGLSKSITLSTAAACPECQGSGFVGRGFCRRCGGTGSISEARTLQVRIPPGVHEGSSIRLKGQGGEGLGGAERGDLYLQVRILPHPVFTLRGRDLETEITLRPEQAVMGDRVTVPTLDRKLTLKVPAGSRSGQKLRLKGKGMPARQGENGDLYARIKIDLPHDLSAEEKELYRQLAELRAPRQAERGVAE